MRKGGFTLIELFGVLAIVAIIAIVFFILYQERFSHVDHQSPCVNNQRQIAISIQMYIEDHAETFPTKDKVWALLRQEPKAMYCPETKTPYRNGYGYHAILENVSYDDLPRDADNVVPEQDIMMTADCTPKSGNLIDAYTDMDERHTGKVVATFLDGHVEVRGAAGLLEMPSMANQ